MTDGQAAGMSRVQVPALLKRKAYSYAACAAAQNFSSVGQELPALTRMLRSKPVPEGKDYFGCLFQVVPPCGAGLAETWRVIAVVGSHFARPAGHLPPCG
jgi:hypothetical protein